MFNMARAVQIFFVISLSLLNIIYGVEAQTNTCFGGEQQSQSCCNNVATSTPTPVVKVIYEPAPVTHSPQVIRAPNEYQTSPRYMLVPGYNPTQRPNVQDRTRNYPRIVNIYNPARNDGGYDYVPIAIRRKKTKKDEERKPSKENKGRKIIIVPSDYFK